VDFRGDRSWVSSLAIDGRWATKSKYTRPLTRRANRMDWKRLPLIVTDGFDFYEKVVRRVFGPAALYAQVSRREGRTTSRT
jgi:hypothetical protein